jgi:hypothetical protein
MNGGSPWYAENMAPSDQVGEYDEYNAYFGSSSSYNRNTVIIKEIITEYALNLPWLMM